MGLSFRRIAKLVAVSAVLSACSNAAIVTPPVPVADYHYSGTLRIQPDAGSLAASWAITVNDTQQSEAQYVMRGTLENILVSGSAVQEFSITPMPDWDGFTAINVTFVPAEGEAGRVLEISYDGILFPEPLPNRINSITSDSVEMSVDGFWFPMDTSFGRLLTADLAIEIGAGWQGVSTGDVTHDGDTLRIHNPAPFLDMAFTLARDFDITPGQAFTLYDLREGDLDTGRLATAAAACIDFLNTRFGQQTSLPHARFILTDREDSGYARQNYIALSSIVDHSDEYLTGFVCHELAHFWSHYANFNTVDNWLNEGLAVYVELLAVRDIYGEDAFQTMLERFARQLEGRDLPAVWQVGATDRGPYLVSYRKAPLALYQLETRIGSEAFMTFLHGYMTGVIRTTPDLLALLEGQQGADTRDWFEQVLAE
jgi:hypothetical protein